ncbi:cupin domain-containing protein [Oceanicoccus sp. KOV_DT_Chl]|uniref:cupin domain-containing protein n=1 Tax=Oceanicoccus sp. KOV_DT_Chl TaxID=1904639 RepID=UPI000C7B7D98|nr:cupin domain-containing protein [Oceanicoccus sp. KOV_DT_Chl]
MTKQQLIKSLELEPHLEGGFFKRTYTSSQTVNVTDTTRPLLSSIYYMLTDDSPIGYFHRNQSDIIHYWHRGSALNYFLISPDGKFSSFTLGPDVDRGEHLQMTVPGNYWKATVLSHGEYGLLSEAVSPGFDYADMQLASTAQMQADFPELFIEPHYKIAALCQS